MEFVEFFEIIKNCWNFPQLPRTDLEKFSANFPLFTHFFDSSCLNSNFLSSVNELHLKNNLNKIDQRFKFDKIFHGHLDFPESLKKVCKIKARKPKKYSN